MTRYTDDTLIQQTKAENRSNSSDGGWFIRGSDTEIGNA
jgi:hypothetical protein